MSGGKKLRGVASRYSTRAGVDLLIPKMNFGVVPEREFRQRVRGILDVLQQQPQYFAMAMRLMQGALTPAIECLQPDGAKVTGALHPGETPADDSGTPEP